MTIQNPDNIIERMIADHQRLISALQSGDVSLRSTVETDFSKALLLSAASYFESRMTESVIQVFQDETKGSDALVTFVRNKAVSRRYHEWFQWDRRNANHFFSAFGQEFRNFMEEKVRNDPRLEDSIRAFMELGETRNQLVHGNFAVFPLGKTVTEVFDLYQKAGRFVEEFPEEIREFLENSEST